jgi:hypothetical protein
MSRTREWYEKQGPQEEWAIKFAMLTVVNAAQIPWGKGKAIWLEDLDEGKPARGTTCPFADRSSIKEKLRNKDWSYYAGYLSTDHSIRKELFRANPEPLVDKKWLQDLTYIYEATEPDRRKFMDGEPVSETEVFAEIGSPETWRVVPLGSPKISRTKEQEEEIARLLVEMDKEWTMPTDGSD